MSFAWSITRCPRPFNTDRAETAAARFAGQPGAEFLRGVAGCSPYLAGLIEREGAWLEEAVSAPPEIALAGLTTEVQTLDVKSLKPGLRQAKRRLALLTALADLGGLWALEQVTGALTGFADLAVETALDRLISEAVDRRKLPASDAPCGGLVALAMGKMGAGELNYSSDIDLVMVFDEDAYDADTFLEARTGLIRVTKALGAMLSDVTADGYVFRTDFRLRPDPAVTPVTLSMEAAERYYESQGRTWERAAYIKARAAAGDTDAGARFLERLAPFVWRRHLDFAAIEDAYDMRSKIRAHKGLYDRKALAGYDLKLARGGIREIEFFTQTRQLIAGGRDPELRARGTVAGLAALADKGWIPEGVCATLQQDYRDLRMLEHRVQMVADQQTHALPRDERGFARIAAMMDRDEVDLKNEIATRRDRVGAIADAFFNPPTERRVEVDVAPEMDEIVSRWPGYPALRSPRAVEKFRTVQPALLKRLNDLDHPQEALRHIDGFLAGLPAGVQLFSLFEANPHLIDLVVDIASVSPELADYLAKNSGVFDAVISGGFFDDWPGVTALTADLRSVLAREGDYEAKLDRTRAWMREWHFRVGVHHLRALIDARQAGQHYADLAEAVLTGLSFPVIDEFTRKHGPPPGRGAMILGMGALGARQLNAASDVDVIVIYDAAGQDSSEGRRPLAARPYFARLTQAMITALTAPMPHGRLYEVDMRLRPSGRQGPVATSLVSFAQYQRAEAWTWEHLALTRARPICGDASLMADIEAVRDEILAQPHDPEKTLQDVRDMRARVAEAQKPSGPLDARKGPGRLQDIALLAQTGALLAGSDARDVDSQIVAGTDALDLQNDDRDHLRDSYRYFWTVLSAMKLVSSAAPLDPGAGAASFLQAVSRAQTLPALEQSLETASDRAAKIIDRALGVSP